ncbi:MAG: YceI family protein [Acidimicrobiia bacterium]|nr:YceI family protein [Acidimicrobiia bacterium]
MKRNVVAVLALGTALAVGGAAWFFTQGDAEPTTEVTAPPIAVSETTGASAPETTLTVPGDEATVPTSFELTDASSATFRLDEELRSSPKTVVGSSGIVLGRIEIDPDDLSNSQIGEILINARDFETDSALRNRAIRGPILDTDTFEFIAFVPSAVEGLEGSASIGEEFSFAVSGDLTIRDITQPVTFDVTATLTSDGILEGTATTVVERGPFELFIPSVPSVANVSEEVLLALDFVAESA